MLNDVISQESVLQLFNLECDDAEEVRCRNVDGFMRVDIRLTPHYESCPECGCIHPVIKDYQTKKIKHSVLSDRKCILISIREDTNAMTADVRILSTIPLPSRADPFLP